MPRNLPDALEVAFPRFDVSLLEIDDAVLEAVGSRLVDVIDVRPCDQTLHVSLSLCGGGTFQLHVGLSVKAAIVAQFGIGGRSLAEQSLLEDVLRLAGQAAA